MPVNSHDKRNAHQPSDVDNSIFEMDGSDLPDSEEHDWAEEWVGMPEFEQYENKPYQCIKVRFQTKEEYEEFAGLVDQNLTVKTKSIWFPALDRDKVSGKRYVDTVMELD